MNVKACRGSRRACGARCEAGLCRGEGILWLTRELRCERTAKTTHPNPWMDYGGDDSGKRYYERPLPRSFGGLLSSYDLRKDSIFAAMEKLLPGATLCALSPVS